VGTGSFPGVKGGRGVTLTPHALLVPWSRKSRAIPLLPLWAVRPVQSLSACTRGALYLPFLTNSLRTHHAQTLHSGLSTDRSTSFNPCGIQVSFCSQHHK